MAEMDAFEVLQYLPQRFPFLMIDRVKECEPGRRILALKNVSANEPHFPGHFPHRPIMPGVLILEAMAQAAGILAFQTLGVKPSGDFDYLYAGIDGARFKRPVIPGDQLEIEVLLQASKRGIWKFNCLARVAGSVVAEADILCSVRASGAEAQ